VIDEVDASDDRYLYDAVLMRIDSVRGILIFNVGGATHRVSSPLFSCFSPGAVGRLRLPTEREPFAFQTYADQRLRRALEADDVGGNRWGWRIGERRFVVQSGLLPGHDGAVVRRDTEAVALDLPREFLDFCDGRGLNPATVLRVFIGDLCGLSNLFECPREDGYTSNGSDERDLAKGYFERAFAWVQDREGRAKVRAAKRAVQRGSTRKKKALSEPSAAGTGVGEESSEALQPAPSQTVNPASRT
jgi:hypothetical protein